MLQSVEFNNLTHTSHLPTLTADTLWKGGSMSDSYPKVRSLRVLLVDDHAMLRQGLRCALEVYPNIEVVGEASDGEEALACVAKVQPTVVVMDICMPRMDGIAATRLIKTRYPNIAVIGLSMERKDYTVYSMQKAGAFDVVPKENAVVELHAAIQQAVAAVQPILIMEETPNPNLALDMSQPSDREESLTETLPVEGPQTGQEKNS
jgi:DNA-binding NarL/FixJ family response regulator